MSVFGQHYSFLLETGWHARRKDTCRVFLDTLCQENVYVLLTEESMKIIYFIKNSVFKQHCIFPIINWSMTLNVFAMRAITKAVESLDIDCHKIFYAFLNDD